MYGMNKYHTRFWSKVSRKGDCLLWEGYCNEKGYGAFFNGVTMKRAHRYIYEEIVDIIPKDLEINHLCRVRNCVNPNHLELVTHTENCHFDKNWEKAALLQKSKTQCKYGHPYDDVNTYITPDGLHRQCRVCRSHVMIARRHPRIPKTHCPQGHEFTPENTYMSEGKYKKCKACAQDARLRYQKRALVIY